MEDASHPWVGCTFFVGRSWGRNCCFISIRSTFERVLRTRPGGQRVPAYNIIGRKSSTTMILSPDNITATLILPPRYHYRPSVPTGQGL
ncbi:hypothetical protein BJX63DRAFT_392939 [Aspergillus granulosus]|uniref:Uncharacterized protein n=1 Tax=Aspergillus granulosus TaxID=176169 RepID=A0ABR4HF36_9EURO